MIMGYKFPNAANVINATYWYDNGKIITGLYIQKKVYSYDSITYIAQWTGAGPGSHSIYVVGKDGDTWQYQTNIDGFNLTAAQATTAKTDSIVPKMATANRLTVDSSLAASSSNAVTDSKAATDIDSSTANTAKATALSIFPNPATTQISVSINSTSVQNNTNLVIYDMSGRMALKKTVDLQTGPNLVTLYLNNLPNGVYLLVVQSASSPAQSRQFVINH
jgi:hypothetical protein